MAEKQSRMTLELVDNVTDRMKKINSSLYRSSAVWGKRAAKFNQFGSTLDNLGTKGLKSVTALGGGLVYSMKMASDYNTEINKLAEMSNLGETETNKLHDSIAKVGKQTGIARKDMASLYRQLGQAGVGVEDLDKIAGTSVNLGRILGDKDYAAVGGELVNTLNAIGVEYKDVGKFLDKATVSTNISNQTLADNMETIQKSGAIFKAAEPNANKYQAVIASLAQKGLNGSESGTMLNATISKVMDTSGKSAKAIEGLGVSMKNSKGEAKGFYDIIEDIVNSESYKKMSDNEKLNFSSKVAGVEHSSRFKALLDSAEEGKLDENKRKIEESQGAFQRFADTIAPLTKHFDSIKSSISNMFLDIGRSLANNPKVISTIKGWADSISNLGEKVKEFGESKKGQEVMAELVKILPKLAIAFAGMKVVGKGAKGIGMVLDFVSKMQRYKAGKVGDLLKDMKSISKANKDFEKEFGRGMDWDDLTRRQQKSVRKAMKKAKKGMIGEENIPGMEIGEVKAGKFKQSLDKLKTLGKDVGDKIGNNISVGISKIDLAKIGKGLGWAGLFAASFVAYNKVLDEYTSKAPKNHQKKFFENNRPQRAEPVVSKADRKANNPYGKSGNLAGKLMEDLDSQLNKAIPDYPIFHITEKIEEGLKSEPISERVTNLFNSLDTWMNNTIPDYPIFSIGNRIGNTMEQGKQWVHEKWNSITSKLGETARGKVEMLKTQFVQAWTDVKNKWQELTIKFRTKLKGKIEAVADRFHSVVNGVKSAWDNLRTKLGNAISGTVSVVGNAVSGNFDTGLSRVPRDNFVANLHKDEMVLTKRQADRLRYGKVGGNSNNIVNHINVKATMDNNIDVENVARTIASKLQFA